MERMMVFVVPSRSPPASVLAVIVTVVRTIPVAEAKLAFTGTKPAGTPDPFRTVSCAHVQAAVFFFCGGKALHLEPVLQFLQGDPLQAPFPQ
jgi:hypothetical protein